MSIYHLTDAARCLRVAVAVIDEVNEIKQPAIQKAAIPAMKDEVQRYVEAARTSLRKA